MAPVATNYLQQTLFFCFRHPKIKPNKQQATSCTALFCSFFLLLRTTPPLAESPVAFHLSCFILENQCIWLELLHSRIQVTGYVELKDLWHSSESKFINGIFDRLLAPCRSTANKVARPEQACTKTRLEVSPCSLKHPSLSLLLLHGIGGSLAGWWSQLQD